MILFVFEGRKREPALFRTIEYLYFRDSDSVICSYENNIYNLFKEMSESAFQMDIASILHEKWSGTDQDPFGDSRKSSDFSEVFLFFDYDCHHQNKGQVTPLADWNDQIREMLNFFSDETGNGKLYINYPMVESIRYTKELPDPLFHTYVIDMGKIPHFKEIAADFSFYKNLDQVCFRVSNKKVLIVPDESTFASVSENWGLLIEQNVKKANYICFGNNEYPKNKSEIGQSAVFDHELSEFVNLNDTVSILNSFPLFLFDYFKRL
jgi:hypothetical protein